MGLEVITNIKPGEVPDGVAISLVFVFAKQPPKSMNSIINAEALKDKKERRKVLKSLSKAASDMLDRHYAENPSK